VPGSGLTPVVLVAVFLFALLALVVASRRSLRSTHTR
jgi:hypothetical protein